MISNQSQGDMLINTHKKTLQLNHCKGRNRYSAVPPWFSHREHSKSVNHLTLTQLYGLY